MRCGVRPAKALTKHSVPIYLSLQNKAAWVAGAVAGGCFVVAIFPGIWLLRWSVKRDMDRCAAPSFITWPGARTHVFLGGACRSTSPDTRAAPVHMARARRHAQKAAEAEEAKAKGMSDDEEAANPETSSKAMKVWNSIKKAATRGLEVDIHEVRAVGGEW